MIILLFLGLVVIAFAAIPLSLGHFAAWLYSRLTRPRL